MQGYYSNKYLNNNLGVINIVWYWQIEPIIIYLQTEGSDDMEINYKVIGERIKNSREKGNMTQSELAKKINEKVSYIKKIEEGSEELALKNVYKISEALNESVSYILEGTSPENVNKDLYELLQKCSPEKQQLIYGIAKIISHVDFV